MLLVDAVFSSCNTRHDTDAHEKEAVFRRVGGEAAPRQHVAVNARSPFSDEETFAPGTLLEYYVQHETQQGDAEARSHRVSTNVQYPPREPH